MASLGFSAYSVMSSASSGGFSSSFPIWIPLISFSSLIIMARTSKTKLNRNLESRHPCFASDLRGNAFSFSPLRMMLAVGLSYMAFYYVEVCSLYAHFLENFFFIICGCWSLSKAFSASVDITLWFLFFNLLMWYITLTNLHILNPCHQWNKSHLIVVYDPFSVLLNSDC